MRLKESCPPPPISLFIQSSSSSRVVVGVCGGRRSHRLRKEQTMRGWLSQALGHRAHWAVVSLGQPEQNTGLCCTELVQAPMLVGQCLESARGSLGRVVRRLTRAACRRASCAMEESFRQATSRARNSPSRIVGWPRYPLGQQRRAVQGC